MLRRTRDQADHGRQFFLYRARLKLSVVVRDAWLIDPSNFVGDVVLDEVCPAGIDVARYLNYHEDPGGISLALRRDPIASVQQVAIPLPGAGNDGWARDVATRIARASGTATPAAARLFRVRRPLSPREVLGREIATALATRLPVNIRDKSESAAVFSEGEEPERWALRASGIFDLIDDPGRVLATLDSAVERQPDVPADT